MQADAMVALVLAVVDDFQVIFMVGCKIQLFRRLGQIELFISYTYFSVTNSTIETIR